MRWYQRLSVKLALLVTAIVGLIILPVGLFSTAFTFGRLKKDADARSQSTVDLFHHEIETADGLMREQVRSGLNILRNESQNLGPASISSTVKIGDQTVPNLSFKSASQANNFSLVDKIKNLTGGTAVLYVKSADNFVSISSNVQKNQNGPRLIGTNLDPQGKAAAALKQGNSFYGATNEFEMPSISGFEPIKNVTGDVIGAWQVAYPLNSFLQRINSKIEQIKFLPTGFLAITDEQNKVISKPSSVSDDVLAVLLQNERGPQANSWNVSRTAFEPWGYNIVSAYSDNDPQLRSELFSIRSRIVMADVLIMLLLLFLITFLTRRFMRPLDKAVVVANEVAEGKITAEKIEVKSNDEVGKMLFAMRNMKAYLQEMSQIADQISAGNLNVQVHPRSEQDRFGLAFKNMLERTLRLVQTQDERDQLQRSIMKLLDEVSDVAEGDLTGQAEVTADATGAIADAFNYMLDELRNLISQVKTTTLQVDTSATHVRLTTEEMMRRSEQQSAELNRLSETFDEMSKAMQDVAEEVAASEKVAAAALNNAKQGNTSVQNNIAAMSRIRSRVQETAERIKRLGERSQEISSIVKIINDLAQRTSVLALNASIQATAAGQSGRGFVAVAEEVERLAERSSIASKQIDALTKAIQGETTEAVVSTESTIREVAVGVKLTSDVGEALNEIEQVSQKLARISQQVSSATRRQAEDSEQISSAMRSVAAVSQQTAQGMKNSALIVSQLAVWAQDLRSSVASFQLPESEEENLSINAQSAVTGSLGALPEAVRI